MWCCIQTASGDILKIRGTLREKKTISYFRVKNKGEISEHLKPVNLYCRRSFGGGLVVPKSRLIPQGDEGVSIRELRNLFLNHFYRQDFV